MKLLILTQKVDKADPILGFFHRWLEEFAIHCQSVIVLCLEKGEYDLPSNVKVLSLGKEAGRSHLKYLYNFYHYILQERKNYDAVFVHMNPEYVVLGGWWWRLGGKKIALWYVHRSMNIYLQIARVFANKILTVTKQSLRFKSKKILAVGHGIDTEMFRCSSRGEAAGDFTILTAGRITKIKNLDVLIRAAAILRRQLDKKFVVNIVGGIVSASDKQYLQYLKQLVEDLRLGEVVRFLGPVPYARIPEYYCQSDLTVNLCPTGGIDKAVLESMAAGVPCLVANEAFIPYLGNWKDQLLVGYNQPEDLATKIMRLQTPLPALSEFLRGQVVKCHNQENLIVKIIEKLS